MLGVINAGPAYGFQEVLERRTFIVGKITCYFSEVVFLRMIFYGYKLVGTPVIYFSSLSLTSFIFLFCFFVLFSLSGMLVE